MKKLYTLVANDFKQIFRDKTLFIFLLAPLILIAFVRFVIPIVAAKFPLIIEYYPYLIMGGSIQTSIMFGFVVTFMILEEKDENVLQVIRVLPISSMYFVFYRLIFATIFSFTGAFLMITLSGIAYPGLISSILLSFQYSLIAAFITLIISTFASNKVEGLAYFKGIDLILMIPMISFFVPQTFKYLFAVIPVFWTYQLHESLLNHDENYILFFVGIMFYAVVLSFLFWQFKKRVFDK